MEFTKDDIGKWITFDREDGIVPGPMKLLDVGAVELWVEVTVHNRTYKQSVERTGWHWRYCTLQENQQPTAREHQIPKQPSETIKEYRNLIANESGTIKLAQNPGQFMLAAELVAIGKYLDEVIPKLEKYK